MAAGSISPRPVAAVILLGVVALAALAWWGTRMTIRKHQRTIADCRQRYAAAHTSGDSATVDMVYLPTYWEQVRGRRASRTCGDLRLAGRLK